MPSAERFEVYPASFSYAGPTTTNLTQMQSFRVNPGVSKSVVVPAGQVDPSAHIVSRAKPRVNFATRDLATLFGFVSPSVGLCTTQATFRLREREECATFSTGATHGTVTAAGTGFIMPDSIAADLESDDGAVCNCQFIPFWDGSTDPLVFNDGVDFAAAPSPAFVSQFFLGAVFHNSVEITGLTSVNLNFGITFVTTPKKAGAYDETGAISRREPILTFTTRKTDAWGGVNLFGSAVTSSVVLYLQKGVNNGTRVARATTQHVSLTMTAGDFEVTELGGDGGQDALLQVTCRPQSTIAVSVAAAIPA